MSRTNRECIKSTLSAACRNLDKSALQIYSAVQLFGELHPEITTELLSFNEGIVLIMNAIKTIEQKI